MDNKSIYLSSSLEGKRENKTDDIHWNLAPTPTAPLIAFIITFETAFVIT